MKTILSLVYMMVALFVVQGVYGEVGDTCTGNDVTNCTSSTDSTDTTGYTCINSICQCSDGFYQDSNNSCQQRHGYNENCFTLAEDSCNVTNGGCYNVTNTCKCNNNFYTDNDNQCKPVSELRPTDFISTTSSTTNITFTWTVSSSDKIKHFIITGTNLPSQPDISNTMTTTTITGLTPGTTYTNIIITAVVSTDRGDVNVSSNVINEVTTKSGYNDSCQTGTCIEENTDCYSTTGNTGSCKCKHDYYRNTVNNMCKNVSDLVPTNVNMSDVTRTSFTINWTRISPQFVSSYIISGEPGISKTVDNNIQSTSINNNIQPGTRYNNILITAVITTDRGTVNVSSTPGLSILTRSDYNESCFTSQDKCNVINGGCYNKVCKCNTNFYTQNNNQCKPVSDLKPADFNSTTSTTNITFTWTVSSSDKIKHFIITGTDLPSQPDIYNISNTMTTTTITGLTPGTTYTNIIITAVVSTDRGDVNVSSTEINEVTTKSGYNDSCQNGTCIEENTDCYSTTGNTGSCKCKQNYYRNTVNNMCKPVSELRPTDFISTTSTTTNITFTWTVSSSDKIKHFIITGTDLPSQPDISNTMTTATITGLTPGTTYTNITITAVVSTDRGDVNVPSNEINEVTTKSGYNDSCKTGTCIEENTDCYSTTGNTGSCKCKQNYYRNTVNNMCKPVSDLVPTNVNISDVTRTSFTINWTRILPQFVSSYIITGEPGISKTVDNNIQSTSINNNIQPGTRYNNILVTAVITTDRGTVNISSTPGLSILTRSDYNENCFTSEDKCNVINGGCYDVTNTCKCNNNFYTQNNNQCKPVSDLKPTDFNSTTSTTTTITFTWTVSSSDKIKHFIITGTNLPSQPDISNTMTTTTITGLTSGTTYTNIIITAVVSTDRGDVNVSSNVISKVTTKSGYNDSCQTGTCIEENTDCYSTTGNTGSCKCKQNYYRNTVNNMCKPASVLVPTNVNISDVTRTSFTITWTRILPQFVSSYIITGEPGISKTVDNNIQSTSINNNIQPGTRYNNILVTAVITTDRGTVNVSSTPGLSILTRSDYNENCSTSEDKCNVINGSCFDVANTCKCNNNFYTDNINQCKPVSDLKPTDFNSTSTTTTNITFTWTVSSSDKIKHFIITGTNLSSQPDISNTMTTTTITGLTPGTTYTNIIITAVVSTDRGDVNVSSNVTSASTVPGKAGDLSTSNEYNTTKTMTIVFNTPDEGSVDYYIVNILNTNVNKTTSTNSIQLGPNTLLPDILYTITITTFYNDKQGETSTQTFRTLADESSPVENLSITDIGSRKLTVSWSYPTDDKGNLTAYILDIIDNGVCIQQYRFFYDVNNQVDLSSMRSCNNVYNISHDLRRRVNQDISNLLPDTTYTVSVIPYNSAGPGQMKQETTKTLIEAAGEITEFSISDVTATSVTFTWKKPTNRPGPTNYTLLIYEQSDLSDENVSHLYHTETITDYNTEKYIAYNLTSFWYYRATIQAATVLGSSSRVSLEKFQTQASEPGPVNDLNVTFIQNNYTAANVTWACPDERDRHGNIEAFTISFIGETDQNNTEDRNITFSDACFYTEVIEVEPSHKYTIKVAAITETFHGEFLDFTYLAPIGKPIFLSKYGDQLIKLKTLDSDQTSLKIEICSSCLLDDTNGQIIFAALIVCVGDKCPTAPDINIGDLRNYTTWKAAKQKSFKIPYRITNNTWHKHISDVSTENVIIGDEGGCEEKDINKVCDGPLNPATEYSVMAVSCSEGGCSSTDFMGKFITKEEPQTYIYYIVAAVLAVLAVILIVGGIVLYRRCSNSNKKPKYEEESVQIDVMHNIPEHPIVLEQFEKHLETLHKDSNRLFLLEFNEEIKEFSTKHETTAASLDENTSKNRYVNILPSDATRVKLRILNENNSSDYVNANYIRGFTQEKEYIASQGPLKITVDDFWRMIWEQDVSVIVMLSDFEENGKPKVSKYFNGVDEELQCGDITVVLKEITYKKGVDGSKKFEVKNFLLKNLQNERYVRHYFLPDWEDYGANLEPEHVIQFIDLVRSDKDAILGKPMVVHCSAGVGRTGTFILLDILRQEIDGKSMRDSIDIFRRVLKLREDRCFMVQSHKQYILVHEGVKVLINKKKKALEQNKESAIYANVGTEIEENIYANQNFVAEDDIYVNVPNGKGV